MGKAPASRPSNDVVERRDTVCGHESFPGSSLNGTPHGRCCRSFAAIEDDIQHDVQVEKAPSRCHRYFRVR